MMVILEIYLYTSLIVSIIMLTIASYNTVWIWKQVNKIQKDNANWNQLNILIPVRNEEKILPGLLKNLRQLLSENSNLSIIILDDNSTDKSWIVLDEFQKHSEYKDRFKLIKGEVLPNGWLGKNWACHQLAEASKNAKYICFVDADVILTTKGLQLAQKYMTKEDLAAFSIFPKQIMSSLGEILTVSQMQFNLLSFLPLSLVKNSKQSMFTAANGQFIMFSNSIYQKFLPHKKMRDEVVEDMAIFKYLKREKQKIAVLSGTPGVYCRMYDDFWSGVFGFAKNAQQIFTKSKLWYFLLLLGYFLFLISPFWVLVKFIINPNSTQLIHFLLLITTLILGFITRIITSINSNSDIKVIFKNILLHPFSNMIYVFIGIISLSNNLGKGINWKNRQVNS